MVLGPGNNDLQAKPLSADILDIEDSTISSAQDISPAVLLGAGLHHVGAARRNSFQPQRSGELESIRELEQELRATKPDGSRHGSYDESLYGESTVYMMLPAAVEMSSLQPLLEVEEGRMSMAGTFTANIYSSDSSDSNLSSTSTQREFGKTKHRGSRRYSADENTDGTGSSRNSYSPYAVLPPIGSRRATLAGENRASLVHAVPIYDREVLDGVLSQSKYGLVNYSAATVPAALDDSPSGADNLPPVEHSEYDNSYKPLLVDRKHEEAIPQIVTGKMEATSLYLTQESFESSNSSDEFSRMLMGKAALPAIPRKRVAYRQSVPGGNKDNPSTHDKSTVINFSELVLLESQLSQQDYQTLEEYLDLAAGIAVADTVKIHTNMGSVWQAASMESSSMNMMVQFDHVSDQRTVWDSSMDSACQCNLSESIELSSLTAATALTVLGGHPATNISLNCQQADFAAQCDLMSNKAKANSGLNPRLYAKQELKTSRTNRVDKSCACSLPHTVQPIARRPSPKLADFVESYVKYVSDTHLSTFNLAPETFGRFRSLLATLINSMLQRMVSVDGKLVSEHQLVHWLKSTNFLTSLDTLLEDIITVAVSTYKHHYALNIDHVQHAEIQASGVHRQAVPAIHMVAPRVESQTVRRLSSRQVHKTSMERRASSRVEGSLLQLLKENSSDFEHLLQNSSSSAPSSLHGSTAQVTQSKVVEESSTWKSAGKKVLKRKRILLPALSKRRMAFLADLLDELGDDEQDFIKAVFSAASPSCSGYMSVTELSTLLTVSTGGRFSLANCRKIMADVDLDADGYLCELDIFSILYLTEIYFMALADGFRNHKLADLSVSFTASHALIFIGLSDLCVCQKLKLKKENNIFLNVTSCIAEESRDQFIEETELPQLLTTLFCLSLLGQSSSFFDTIWPRLVHSTKVKMDGSDVGWQPKDFVVPVYKKNTDALVFPILNKHLSRYPKMPYMVRRNCALVQPAVPPIHIRGPNIDYNPLFVYNNAGIRMFHRQKTTSYGIEERSRRPACIISLREIKKLADKQQNIPKLFLESVLFDSRKHREIVGVFSSNQLKVWPRETLPSLGSHRHSAVSTGSRGAEERFTDLPFDIHNVLEILKKKPKEQHEISSPDTSQ